MTDGKPPAKRAASKRAAAAKRPALRSVPPADQVDEKPADDEAPEKPLTVTEAAEKGDRLALLEAMRRRIAQTVESPKCPPRDLASLSRRLIEIDEQIAELKSREGGDDIGEAANTPDEPFDAGAI